nr:nucleoid-associated protein [Bacteroidales bacterium]
MFKNLITSRIVVHFIGNKSVDEGVKLSKKIINTDEELRFILSDFFTNSFKSAELFNLYHQGDLKFNEVYGYVSEIFDDPGSFYNNSVNLARRLYEKSSHPKVKSGEFCVVYFEDCEIQGETVDALGLFKSENKDVFLKIIHADGNFTINSEEGININKLDKGCLIFNTEKEKGYLVSIVDNANK